MAQRSLRSPAREAEGLTQTEAIGMAVAVTWMVGVGIYFWTIPTATDPDTAARLRQILMMVAVFLPVGLMWVALFAARANRRQNEDILEMRAALDRTRLVQDQLAAQQAVVVQAPAAVPQQELQPSPQKTEAPASNFRTRREVSRLIVPRAAPQMPGDQPALELGLAAEPAAPPLDQIDLIKALNFPDDEHDTEGFAALRRALRDRTARRLVRASQDVLTLLSQDGIYMDDLRPEPIPADLWRRFAKGERGKEIDSLGAIRDRDALARTTARMREDTIFRDAVHHFLRRFDQMLLTFQEEARDIDFQQLAETRTARAFMLLARAAGAFD
ncbi:MAG: hypothetical protein AAFU41_02290 [Pseudomonadota bacterium]